MILSSQLVLFFQLHSEISKSISSSTRFDLIGESVSSQPALMSYMIVTLASSITQSNPCTASPNVKSPIDQWLWIVSAENCFQPFLSPYVFILIYSIYLIHIVFLPTYLFSFILSHPVHIFISALLSPYVFILIYSYLSHPVHMSFSPFISLRIYFNLFIFISPSSYLSFSPFLSLRIYFNLFILISPSSYLSFSPFISLRIYFNLFIFISPSSYLSFSPFISLRTADISYLCGSFSVSHTHIFISMFSSVFMVFPYGKIKPHAH
ncbi:unnamed protein product [Acanthosepion pharaonis]|uniref:Uncharacterized protein n=1 Tax=Acanthosepion pharaonis TaxID=158019 RepID=A0A812D5W6_ACAPH|nr:unnamed protein product [Sepia pharaonis]